MRKSIVGIFLFDGVDLLDLAGPFEVFSRTRLTPGVEARKSEETAPFHVVTVAQTTDAIVAGGGLRILPQHVFSECPPLDILVIPGGLGTRRLLNEDAPIQWIRNSAPRVKTLASVCTGALLLAQAGLLRNRHATTHWGAFDLLSAIEPTVKIDRAERVVRDGVITAAGVAAGIDMALTIVELLHGQEVADETARYIEFPRTRYSLSY